MRQNEGTKKPLYGPRLSHRRLSFSRPLSNGVYMSEVGSWEPDAPELSEVPVSYTHLTLPTNREV